MLLIVGHNEGKGKALSMALTKQRIYSAFVSYERLIHSFKNPTQKVKRRSIKRIDPTSMDYYLELYRLDTEEEPLPEEPLPSVSGFVLLLPDGGETQAETVMEQLTTHHPSTKILALCEHPAEYMPYMSSCQYTIFASIDSISQITVGLRSQISESGFDFACMRFGHLRLYADEVDAYLYGRRLYLTPKEYDVLRFLCFHVGMIFSAESIMAYCFPSTFARLPSNAVTHICRINQKAKKVAGKPLIRCKKGLGYYVPEEKAEP